MRAFSPGGLSMLDAKEFLKICQGKKGLIVSAHDAYMATKIALAAMKSAKGKKRVAIV